MLSPLDKLYVVHVFKDGKKEREKEGSKWCAGGPLLPAMATALSKFPHQIVELEVRNPLLSRATILAAPPSVTPCTRQYGKRGIQ